jgi:hypothetical protein
MVSGLAWLVAVAAVVVLARLRGARAVKILLASLVLIILAVIVWNSSISLARP